MSAARTPDKVERVATEIVAAGGRAIGVPTDVSREGDLSRLVDAAHEAFGPIDVVFNNAHAGATAVDLDPWGIPDEVWFDAVAVNLLAPYRLARMVVPEMKAAGRGSIVTLLRVHGVHPIPPQLAYGATKSGLHVLSTGTSRRSVDPRSG